MNLGGRGPSIVPVDGETASTRLEGKPEGSSRRTKTETQVTYNVTKMERAQLMNY